MKIKLFALYLLAQRCGFYSITLSLMMPHDKISYTASGFQHHHSILPFSYSITFSLTYDLCQGNMSGTQLTLYLYVLRKLKQRTSNSLGSQHDPAFVMKNLNITTASDNLK